MEKSKHEHMIAIQKRFIEEHAEKYKKGALEHKSHLGKDYNVRQMLDMLKEEVIDLVSYVYTLEMLLEHQEVASLRISLDDLGDIGGFDGKH